MLAELLVASFWAQERVAPEEPRYHSMNGKFSMVLPAGFDAIPLEESGRETNQILAFNVNRSQTAFIRGIIYKFDNPKYLTLEKWAENGRKSWIAQPGYKEQMYAQVDFKNAKAWVHIFEFYNLDQNERPRDRMKMKSIRTMRGKIGYWFVFYCTPKFYDDYCSRFDAALNTIKFVDE